MTHNKKKKKQSIETNPEIEDDGMSKDIKAASINLINMVKDIKEKNVHDERERKNLKKRNGNSRNGKHYTWSENYNEQG